MAKKATTTELPYITTINADHGYRVKNEQTTRYKIDEDDEGTETVVIQGWIVVKEVRKNYKTGSSVYVLIGRDKRGKEFEIALPSDVFYGQPWRLKAAIAPHFDLKTGFFLKSGKDNLQNIIASTTNDNYKKTVTEFDQVIWHNGKIIIPSLEPAGTRCLLNKDWFPYQMPPDLNIDMALEIYDTILASTPIENVMPLIILTFISPVVGLLFPDYRYGYAIVGESGWLKTAMARALLSVYGEGFKHGTTLVKLGEGSTNNAATEIAAMAGVMPMLLDNFKPYADYDKNKLSAMVNNIIEGSSKARMKKEGGLQDTKKYLCCLLITCEDYSLETASQARVMTNQWIKPDTTKLFKIGDPRLDHMPAIGYSWLTWLQTDEGKAAIEEFRIAFPERRKECAEQFKNAAAPNPERLGSNMALEKLGLELMSKHPVFGQYFKKFEKPYNDTIVGRTARVADATRNGSEAEGLMDLLREKIARGIFKFNPDIEIRPPNVLAGWQDKWNYYIYPSEVRKLLKELAGVQRLGLSQIGNQLKSRGYISPGRDRNQRSERNPDGERVWVYVFPKDKIQEEHNEVA